MTDEDALQTLREMEIAWLSDTLAASIANLGYPVGCGVAPSPDHLKNAAGKLADRYIEMIRMAREAAMEKAA